jgi:hypothetical protein
MSVLTNAQSMSDPAAEKRVHLHSVGFTQSC